MSRRTGLVLVLAFVGAVALILASVGMADHGRGKGKSHRSLSVKLIGYQEVPAISTEARGKIRLKLNNSGGIDYRLSYSGLTTPAFMAHIHFAQFGVNGGIMLWLCDSATAPSPVATTPECPAGTTTKAEVSGTLAAADVQAIAAQSIAAGNLDEALAAIRAGVAYANVHSSTHPGGEIRGQLNRKQNHG
jgi:hypothetical protein